MQEVARGTVPFTFYLYLLLSGVANPRKVLAPRRGTGRRGERTEASDPCLSGILFASHLALYCLGLHRDVSYGTRRIRGYVLTYNSCVSIRVCTTTKKWRVDKTRVYTLVRVRSGIQGEREAATAQIKNLPRPLVE